MAIRNHRIVDKSPLDGIPAASWNRAQEAADRVLDGGWQPRGPERGRRVVRMRNDAGVAVQAYECLGIGGVAITNTDNLDEYLNRVTYLGVDPLEEHKGKFAVCGLPMATGQVAPVTISGDCVAWINVTDEAHEWAEVDPTPGKRQLISSGSGSVRILYKPAGTGAFPCHVRLHRDVCVATGPIIVPRRVCEANPNYQPATPPEDTYHDPNNSPGLLMVYPDEWNLNEDTCEWEKTEATEGTQVGCCDPACSGPPPLWEVGSYDVTIDQTPAVLGQPQDPHRLADGTIVVNAPIEDLNLATLTTYNWYMHDKFGAGVCGPRNLFNFDWRLTGTLKTDGSGSFTIQEITNAPIWTEPVNNLVCVMPNGKQNQNYELCEDHRYVFTVTKVA